MTMLSAVAVAQKEYIKVWENDLSTTDGWTFYGNTKSNLTTNHALVSGDSYLNLMTINGKDGDNIYEFKDANFESTTDYIFEFDLAIYGSNANNHLAHLYLNGESGVQLFSVDCTGYNTFTIKAGDKNQDISNLVTANDRNTRDQIGAATMWCHYTVTSNATDGTTLTVESWNGETKSPIISEAKLSDNFIKLASINLHGGSYMQWSIDNMKLSVYSEEVLPPSALITGIDGKKREITMTSPVEGYKIYYYTTENPDPQNYTAPIVLETSTTLSYYAENETGARSDIMTLEINCVPVKLNAPTITRIGADTYTLTSSQVATDGITPIDKIHYTIGLGQEQSVNTGETISGVNGDIVAWTEATGFISSDKVTMEYTAAYNATEKWSYNLNSYPSTTGNTNITDAINTETGKELNGITVYNLNDIDNPDLFIENSKGDNNEESGWLLRNQSSNAFKCQYGESSMIFNNVDKNNVIYIDAYRDNGGMAISNVVNGEIKYSYGDTEYFIVPSEAGAVTVTFRKGVSINTVSVSEIVVPLTIGETGYTTLYNDQALDFTGTGIVAYIGSIDGNTVKLSEVKDIPANTAVILKGEPNTYELHTVGNSETDVTANDLKGTAKETYLQSNESITCYALRQLPSSGNVGFAMISENGVIVPKGKAYIAIETPSTNILQYLSINMEVNGITDIVKTQTHESDEYFNLMGTKVRNPQKGLYIKNGKKVIIK